jgi:hypothetical protein
MQEAVYYKEVYQKRETAPSDLPVLNLVTCHYLTIKNILDALKQTKYLWIKKAPRPAAHARTSHANFAYQAN